MVARIKAIKPTRKFLGDINALERELEAGLDEAADEAQALYEKTVKTWRTKVNFAKRKTRIGRSIGTSSVVYAFVDLGTKPHVIRAKRAPALRFRVGGFKPKTKVNTLNSYKGAPGQSWVSRESVNHPGTKARNFTKIIEEKMRKRQYVIMRRRLKGLFSPRGG